MSASQLQMAERGVGDGFARRVGPVGRRLGVLVMVVCAVGGCKESSKNAKPKRISAQGVSYLEGIPVPSGFRLVHNQVIDHESAGRRLARHEYEGRLDSQEVRNFYRRQMPGMGWKEVTGHDFGGLITLRYEDKTEACTVVIEEKGLFGTTTSIRVLIEPFERSNFESPARPVP